MTARDVSVGGTGLPPTVQKELGEFVARLNDMCEFKNGSVAVFFHIAYILSQHITTAESEQ